MRVYIFKFVVLNSTLRYVSGCFLRSATHKFVQDLEVRYHFIYYGYVSRERNNDT